MFRLTVGTVVAVNVRGLVLLYANTAATRGGKGERDEQKPSIHVQAVNYQYMYTIDMKNYQEIDSTPCSAALSMNVAKREK